GTARPSSLIRKSCTRTSSGSPCLRHSRPAFLKSPTSSFFLVSTDIAGWFSAMAVLTASLITQNCASRSGLSAPSRVLLLACRLNFCFFSNSPTTVWLILCPSLPSSSARRRRLLQVLQPPSDRGAGGDPRHPRHRGYAAISRRTSFRRDEKPALTFIQLRRYRQVARLELAKRLFIDHPTTLRRHVYNGNPATPLRPNPIRLLAGQGRHGS